MMERAGLLVLADGTVFRGVAVGADGIATGEVVFNTAMAGYQEIFTDPSYARQIVTMTAPHIGNYGTTPDDAQAANPFCTGVVMRSMSHTASSWRSRGLLSDWFTDMGLIALSDVDTRRLTRHVRDHGAMPAAIGSGTTEREMRDAATSAPVMEGRALALEVSIAQPTLVRTEAARRGTVVAYDFGMKRAIVDAFTARGFDVQIVPADTPAGDVRAFNPDGVFLSNGPGDPEPLDRSVAAVRELLGTVPLFGICLGHQVLGLAVGGRTYKLPFGHHGGNHPVRRIATGKVAITSQNHGFAVDLTPLRSGDRYESEFGEIVPTHVNLNDNTLEGLRCPDANASSVQYHPEARPGPNDAQDLFDTFCDRMGVS
ncbi:Carbamoyl-phosphate synthase small chain [hydrothermal vent metagenome]|uniref:carbamoyl-phosphate synthase (glutamine-hydrolyzing) n=1 Tax=hydrothermal vent metagenome TaxID=652676 RepID=A0A3B0T8A8_9ZZZZ